MPIPTFTGLPPYPEFSDVTAKINKLVQELQNLMLSLDTLNIAELNAEVIIANTITADKMNVSELSAITANMGTITAGLMIAVNIIGSYIATANGTYPRCEMSSHDNLFAAYGTADKYITISPDIAGQPTMNMISPLVSAMVTLLSNALFIATSVGHGNISISSGEDLVLHAQGLTRVDSWSTLFSNLDGQTLQTALNSKATAGASTGSGGGVTLNGGIPIGTLLATAGGGTVTWAGVTVPSHSHTQT